MKHLSFSTTKHAVLAALCASAAIVTLAACGAPSVSQSIGAAATNPSPSSAVSTAGTLQTAGAAAPSPASATTSPVASTTHRTTTTGSSAGSHRKVGDTSSTGYTITNNSQTVMIFQRVAGSLPAPYVPGGSTPMTTGSAWLPGQTLDFELPFDWTNPGDVYIGDALFLDYSPANGGASLGPVDVHLRSDGGGYLDGPSEITTNQQSRDGYPGLDSADGLANQILGSGAPWTWDLGSDSPVAPGVTEGDVLQSVCEASGDQCQYTASAVTTGFSPPEVLVSNYGGEPSNGPTAPDPNTPGSGAQSNGTIDATGTWSTSQTDSYSITDSLGANLESVLNAGIQKTSTYEFSSGYQFSTGGTQDVYLGYTSELSGSYPVYTATGNLSAALGNVTWNFSDANFTYPRSDGTQVDYSQAFIAGNTTPPPAPGYIKG